MHKKRSRVVSLLKKIPSAMLCSLELHITWSGKAAFGYIFGKCYSASDTGVMIQKRHGLYCAKMCFPSVAPAATIPSSLGSDSYLVEVGGPDLSLLGLSFICELFVCSALHCHTALANLPNESQELHNGKNDSKTAFIITDCSALH